MSHLPTETPGDDARSTKAFPAGTLMELMRMELVDDDPRSLVVRMPVAGNTQPYGLLHGGASAALAETAGSLAANLGAQRRFPGEDAVAVGVDLNITHHRAVREGWVTATARPLHEGRTTATYEVVITDDGGRRVATARITNAILRARP